ncbi:MAG: helix-turn-helix transcriptional regulator [Deltaproteobacteria bacterium]|nr:helix-turn-helix transcriptional regulator [Deltaproteobacteria bacterium]
MEKKREAEKYREKNNVKKIRESQLMSKAELARRASVSVLTIDRIEKGMRCRVDTKRKIILALGLKLTDKNKVFGNDNEG